MDFTWLNDPIVKMFLTGIFVSGFGYLTSQAADKKFSLKMLAATVVTSVFVVFVLLESGATVITEADIVAQMVVFGAVTLAVYRFFDYVAFRIFGIPQVQMFIVKRSRLQGVMNPLIKFTATPRDGVAPLTVTVKDTSDLVKYWSFGDAYVNAVPREAYAHIYQKAGVYQIRGHASGTEFSDAITITVIAPKPEPVKKNFLEILWIIIKAFFGK